MKTYSINTPPFPGMDPYLEGNLWSEFHQRLANQISSQLMAVLPPNYVALLDRYYAIDYAGMGIADASKKQGIYPDVHVAKIKEPAIAYKLAAAPAVELVSPIPEKAPFLRVEIRDVDENRLVTVIEILSPANKLGEGFREYVKKRTALLKTSTHLLELDLLRGGRRLSFWGGKLPPAPYYIFLSRFTRRPHTEVWPIQLRESLPTIPVPLLSPDPDALLDLQEALDACFNIARYHERLLNYSQPPPPPSLSEEDTAWVESVAKEYIYSLTEK